METIEYRFGNTNDKENISRLHSRLNLSNKDIELQLDNFIVATVQDRTVGCIAAELYGEHCLLRSMAVDEAFRNNGIGRQLCNYLFSFVYENGVTNIHLLTERAEHYFQKSGFVITDRQTHRRKSDPLPRSLPFACLVLYTWLKPTQKPLQSCPNPIFTNLKKIHKAVQNTGR